ncbi:cupin domain-containing protein [Paraburkholderia azotifigens]
MTRPMQPVDRDELIRRFDLQPHPEGGFFRETYRSADSIRRDGSADRRSASTAIYYLLCDGAHSAWHRIQSDEVWHFYAGDPLNVYVLEDDGALTVHRLGNALEHADCVFQAVVPSGRWFAAQCDDAASLALVGCTVAPGFEFNEFEIAQIEELRHEYPQHRELIAKLGPVAAR